MAIEEENDLDWSGQSEKDKRFLSIAQVNDPGRLDYGSLLSPTARALEKILPMQDPPITGQSYGPGLQALWGTANHEAVRKRQDEMRYQSGVDPKPGDPPSFAPTAVGVFLGRRGEQIDGLRNLAILGGHFYDQATGQGEARTRARLDAVRAEKQARGQQKSLMSHEVIIPGDPAQSIFNGQRYLAETLGGNVVDSLGIAVDYVGSRLGGPGYWTGKAAVTGALDTGNNLARRYDKTGELNASGVAAFGMISGVVGAIPTPVEPSGAKKIITDKIKQAAVDTGKKQIQNWLGEAAVMDNSRAEQWQHDREQWLHDRKMELANDFIKSVLYHNNYGGW